jgi:hypothetical protein
MLDYVIEKDVTKIIYTNRKQEKITTTIDTEDLEKILNFHYSLSIQLNKHSKEYYANFTTYTKPENGKRITKILYLHNFIMGNLDGYIVDHINHNTLDNRKENLRHIAKQSNETNRKSKNSNNKSGHRNVCLVKDKWVVQLQIDGKNTKLKSFPLDQLDEAGKFAEEMRQKYYGDFSGEN